MAEINLRDYINLIKSFLTNQLSGLEFEGRYLSLFKNDETLWRGDVYETLNELFTDVDAFCDDPSLFGPDDLNEEQLRSKCESAYARLLELHENYQVR